MQNSRVFHLSGEEATSGFARALEPFLRPGDVILLEGPVGAGKTHFARALIRARLGDAQDVPSPTYTLVQVYGPPDHEIWHSDLYRLSGPDEAHELGLTEAFETAICLVEWPDRLGDLRPIGALTLTFETENNDAGARRVTALWTDPRWTKPLQEIAP